MPERAPSQRSRHPSGCVTFLFADLNLKHETVERDPDASALVRIAAVHRGYVFEPGPRVLRAAFATANAALNSAVEVMRFFYTSDAGTSTARIAMDTGDAAERGTEYSGSVPCRLDSLLDLASPGQLLVSQTTCDQLTSTLPDGISLCDLGTLRPRDLTAAVRVYRVDVAGLPSDLAQLSTLDLYPHNLPVQPTHLVGRATELDRVTSLLPATRLLTLTGIGGTGKTHLALQAAANMLPDFPDGTWFVDLGPLSSLQNVTGAVATALGVRAAAGRPLSTALVKYLQPKSLLLILDHCDNLIDDCAELAERLLISCSNLRIVATSRNALGIPQEMTYRVPSLALPAKRDLLTPKSLRQSPSVHYFVEQAQIRSPSFQLTRENFIPVAQICERLDGIPLAMALAAAKLHSLPADQLEAKLDEYMAPLVGTARSGWSRQQILRATLDWSYNRLRDRERKVLLRLSAFAGSWTRGTAGVLCAEDISTIPASSSKGGDKWVGKHSVADLVERLVALSLVRPGGSHDAQRFRLPEMVREYAQEKLSSAEAQALATQHLECFAEQVSHSEASLYGRDQTVAAQSMELDYADIRAALDCAVTPSMDENEGLRRIEAGLNLAWSLKHYWYLNHMSGEALSALTRLISHPLADRSRASFTRCAGLVHFFEARSDMAAAPHPPDHQSVDTLRAIGDKPSLAQLLAYLGFSDDRPNDFASRTLAEEGVQVAREINDRWSLAFSLTNLGTALRGQGDYEGARSSLSEALALFEGLGDRSGIVRAVRNLWPAMYQAGDIEPACELVGGWVRSMHRDGERQSLACLLLELGRVNYLQGEMANAEAQLAESARIFQAVRDRIGLPSSIMLQGYAAVRKQAYQAAADYLRLALELCSENGDLVTSLECVAGLAGLYVMTRDSRRAARLFGSVEAHLEKLGLTRGFIDQMHLIEQMEYDRNVGTLRSLMDGNLTQAWSEGRRMSIDEVAAIALDAAPWPIDWKG